MKFLERFKRLALFIAAFLTFNNAAIAAPLEEAPALQSSESIESAILEFEAENALDFEDTYESSEDALSDSSCFLDVLFTTGSLFGNRGNAERFCSDLDVFSGLRGFCTVRSYNDAFHSGRFRFRHRFNGRDRGSIFNSFFDFTNRHRFNDGRFISAFQWGVTC